MISCSHWGMFWVGEWGDWEVPPSKLNDWARSYMVDQTLDYYDARCLHG